MSMSQFKPRSKSETNLTLFGTDEAIQEDDRKQLISKPLSARKYGNKKGLKRSTSLSSLRETNLTEGMRNHITDLKQQLNEEKFTIKQIKRDKITEINLIKDEQQKKYLAMLEEKEWQLKRHFEKEVVKEKENLQKHLERENNRITSEKESKFYTEREAWNYEKETLLQKIEKLNKTKGFLNSDEKNEALKQKLEREIFSLQEDNKYLQEEIKMFQEAGRNHVVENKQLYEEHLKEIEKLKKTAQLESKKQLSELKQLQNVIEQLEKKLGFEAGTCMRLQMEKDALDIALSKMKQAESQNFRNLKSLKRIDHQGSEFDIEGLIMELPARLSSKPHNDPERVLYRKYVEVCSLVRRLDESNQQLSLRNEELVEENKAINESMNPLEEKIVKLGNKNMELSQSVRRSDSKMKDVQKEVMDKEERIIHLQHLIEKKDKKIKQSKKKENAVSEEEFEDLQRQLCEQLQIISELRQQNIDKDRRIDVLKKRALSEKQSTLGKKRKSLSLDSLDVPEIFETVDDNKFTEDIDTIIDESNENRLRYSKLTKEHLELQNAFALLQRQCLDIKDPQRSELQKEALQSDVLVLQATVAELENKLKDRDNEIKRRKAGDDDFESSATYREEGTQKEDDPDNDEISTLQLLTDENKELQMRLISSESELVEKTIQLKQMTEELKELLDHNDLMEFQIAELEQGKKISRGDGKLKLTDADKQFITTEVDEVECDAISVRIALKELEINNRNHLTDKEKQTLVQARALVDKGATEINSLQDENYHVNNKNAILNQQYEIALEKMKEQEKDFLLLQNEKLANEEKHLTSIDDLISNGFTSNSRNQRSNSLDVGTSDKSQYQLQEAKLRIRELEKTNEMLMKKWETSGGSKVEFTEDEIVILRTRMDQMREAEKKISLLQVTNDDLIRRLERFEEVSDEVPKMDETKDNYLKKDLPEKISKEIESLRLENRELLDELGTLKTTADGALAIAEKTKEVLNKDDRATQTPSFEYINFSATLANLGIQEATSPDEGSNINNKKNQSCQTSSANHSDYEIVEKTYVKEVKAQPVIRVDHYNVAFADQLEQIYSPNEEQLHSDNEFIQKLLEEYDDRKSHRPKSQSPMSDQQLGSFGVYLHETLPEDNSKSSSERALSDFSVQAQHPSSSRQTELISSQTSKQRSPRSVTSYQVSTTTSKKDKATPQTNPLSIEIETSQEDVEDIPLDISVSEDQRNSQPQLPSTCSTCGLTPPHRSFLYESDQGSYPYQYIPRAYSNPGFNFNSQNETANHPIRINEHTGHSNIGRHSPLSVQSSSELKRPLPPYSVVLNKTVKESTIYERNCVTPDDSMSYGDRDIKDLLDYAKQLRHAGTQMLTDSSPDYLTPSNIPIAMDRSSPIPRADVLPVHPILPVNVTSPEPISRRHSNVLPPENNFQVYSALQDTNADEQTNTQSIQQTFVPTLNNAMVKSSNVENPGNLYKEVLSDQPTHYCRCDVDSGIGSMPVESKKSKTMSPNFWSPRHAPTRHATRKMAFTSVASKDNEQSEATSKDIASLPKEKSCTSDNEQYDRFVCRLENRSCTSTPDFRSSDSRQSAKSENCLVNENIHERKQVEERRDSGVEASKISEPISSNVELVRHTRTRSSRYDRIKIHPRRRHSTGSLEELPVCEDDTIIRERDNNLKNERVIMNENMNNSFNRENIQRTRNFFKRVTCAEETVYQNNIRVRGRSESARRFHNLPRPISRRSFSHSPTGRNSRRASRSRSPVRRETREELSLVKRNVPSHNSLRSNNADDNNVPIETPLKLPENPGRPEAKHRLDKLIEDTDRRLHEKYDVIYGEHDCERELIFEEEDLRQASKEIYFLREKCESLERQLENRDDVLNNLQNELREESENIALIEKKDKEIHLKAESISHITQMLQKTRKELEIKITECNRRESEVKHLKHELKNVLSQKKSIESSHSEQQITIVKLESVETKLQQLTVRYDEVVQHNRELLERIKTLEISEKEFIDLERNVIDLQVQLRDMEDIELHRDELFQKLQYVKKQRDEFLEKGKLVEEERNEFVRSNKTLEQYLVEWKRKTVEFKKTNQALKDRILNLERDKKELEERIMHLQEERVIIQTNLNKVELERDDYIRELKEVTLDRNSLETRLGDLEDMLGDYDQLEEGFHSLRLKVAELTRQRDDAEMLIPSYKQKLHALKKGLHEKEDTIMQLSHDLKTLKVAVENCTFEDLTKLKSFNYLSSDSSLPRRPSFNNRGQFKRYFTDQEALHENNKYRPSDYDLTTDSDSYDPLFIRPSQQYESYSDDSIQRHQRSRRNKARRCVALFDYDPHRSSTSDHPERELRLREGDYITVYGEMDIDGYLEAESGGVKGLVPSIYVEDISDDGSMEYRKKSHHHHQSHHHSDYSDESLVRKFRVLYDYDPFTMATTDNVDRQLSLRKGDVVTVYGNMDEEGYFFAQKNGKRGMIPSNFVEEYSSSGSSHHHQQHQQQSEMQQSSANYQGTIEIEEDAGPPYAPRDLKVVRVVTRNAVLLGWGLPPMDEYGRSNGCRVTGYRLWVNGKRKQDCNSPSMTKALVDDIDLHGRVEFSIQTVGENGFCSEKCHFAITGALSALSKENDFEMDSNQNTYVALYDYDPYKSSPNPNPSLELSFQEGDLIRVYDKSRNDGFYGAEISGKRGLVPSNFIERIGGSGSSSSYHHHTSNTVHHDSDSNSRRVQFKKD